MEAVFFLFLSKLIISLFRFKRIITYTQFSPEQGRNYHVQILSKIKTAIQRADKLSIWKNKCLVRSLAARMMLRGRRISSVFHLGARFKDSQSMEAHAWLTVGEMYLTQPLPGFRELHAF